MTLHIVVNDTHSNSTVSMCPPVVPKADGDSHIPGDPQRWLYDQFLLFCDHVGSIKESKILYLNGDIVDLSSKYQSNQIITANKEIAKDIACEILDPLVSVVDLVYVIQGTESHVEDLEIGIAKDIGGVANPQTKKQIWDRLCLIQDGVSFDVSHHTGMGHIRRLRGAFAQRTAHDIFHEYNLAGERPPDIVLRGHQHRWGDSYDDCVGTRVIVTPCWTYQDRYISKVSLTGFNEWGATMIYTGGGNHKYEVEKWKVKNPQRVWHTPELPQQKKKLLKSFKIITQQS